MPAIVACVALLVLGDLATLASGDTFLLAFFDCVYWRHFLASSLD